MNKETTRRVSGRKNWRSVALSGELYAIVKERAAKNRRSMSSELALIIEQVINEKAA